MKLHSITICALAAVLAGAPLAAADPVTLWGRLQAGMTPSQVAAAELALRPVEPRDDQDGFTLHLAGEIAKIDCRVRLQAWFRDGKLAKIRETYLTTHCVDYSPRTVFRNLRATVGSPTNVDGNDVLVELEYRVEGRRVEALITNSFSFVAYEVE